jgi:hypothetical protein
MSNAVPLQAAVSFAAALGVDLLGAGSPVLGLATGLDVEACGTGLAAAIDLPLIGTNDTVALLVQTGTANDDAVLLVGGEGVDSTFGGTSVIMTGGTMIIARIPQGGLDTLGRLTAMTSLDLAYDMSIALTLHRIDIATTHVPVPVFVETGCAL